MEDEPAERLRFRQVSHEGLVFDGVFGVGVHQLIGTPNDHRATLLALAAGQVKPSRGSVTFDGAAPFNAPDLRRRIGSAVQLQLPNVRSVRHAIEVVAALRGQGTSLSLEALDAVGGDSSLDLAPDDLDISARARVALALALGHETAELLVLHEPFEVPGIDGTWLTQRLDDRAQRAVVLLSAREPAVTAAQSTLAFRFGAITPFDAENAGALEGSTGLTLLADRVEPLAQQLLALPEVTRCDVLRGQPGLLRVHFQPGPDVAERVSLAALSSARQSGVYVAALELLGGRRP